MMRTGILAAAVAALALQSGAAWAKPKPVAAPVQAPLPYQSANLPTSGEVRAFYAGWRFAPIWFNGNAVKPAATELIEILRRAPLDGIGAGPQYAAQVQAAVQQAATGTPQAIAFADHSLSEALVLYAQVMQRPVRGMIYGYQQLKPTPPRADQILRTAAGAPSLQIYLQQIANPNPIYVSIRDAAWRQMQASGSTVPDARVVANLDRARPMPARGRFVLVDSATQRLFMYENGVPVDSMKVIVGERAQPTPLIASYMYYVVFNPYWNAPNNLVRKIAKNVPSLGMGYLKSRGYEVMQDWTANSATIDPTTVDWKAVASGKQQIRVRQKPGNDNFMGELKFPFANPEDIFLHDTPSKQYFNQANRDISNGCVRLEDARRLGRWLLGREPVAPSSEAELQVQVPRAVPIYLTYLTAQVTDGQLAFVKDIYGWDPAGGGTQVASGR